MQKLLIVTFVCGFIGSALGCGGRAALSPTTQGEPSNLGPTTESTDSLRPTGSPEATSGFAGIDETDHSMDYLGRLPAGDDATLPFAQRTVFGGVLVTAYNAALIDNGAPISQFEELLPYIAVWPQDASGDLWPMLHDTSGLTQPAVVQQGGGSIERTALFVPVHDGIDPHYAWDTASLDREAEAVHTTLEHFSGAASHAKYTAMAAGLLKPLSHYWVIFGTYPESPEAAYERLDFSLHTPGLRLLQKSYGTLTFMRERAGQGVGLLLEGDGQPTLLIYHEPKQKGNASLRDLGFTESEQVRLNQMLPAWEPWGSLEPLPVVDASVPAMGG